MKEIKKIIEIDKKIELIENELETLNYNRKNLEKDIKINFYNNLVSMELFVRLNIDNVELWISDLDTENQYGINIRLKNITNFTENVLKQIKGSIKELDKNLKFDGFQLNSENQINLHYYRNT